MKKINYSTCINHIDQWDKRLILKYNKIDNKFIIYFFVFISFFGRETIWLFLIFYFLFLWYDPTLLIYIGLTFLNGIWLNMLIKNKINRERPFETIKEITIIGPIPASKSFPSWHAYNGMAQTIILVFLSNSLFYLIFLSIFAILLGLSRIILGVHYPSDVIAGFILGIIGALITILFFGPLLLLLIANIEQFLSFEIHYRRINPLLGNIWYFFVCVLIFGLILLSAIYKYIKKD